VITPRVTRLVRVGNLQAFREAVASLAIHGSPLDARDRLLIVPTSAAAEHLVRGLENAPFAAASILPDTATASEMLRCFADRLPVPPRQLSDEEREVLLGVACRAVVAGGIMPPFRVRPGLVAEMLRFYDRLRRNLKDVATFERLALGILEPGAADDRGARQLVDQTRFLAAVFADFERRASQHGADEHELRRLIISEHPVRPYRHVIVTVSDRAFDPHGLTPVDWDLLARAPGIEHLDVVVTDRRLAGALHERMHTLLPGIQEVRFEPAQPVSVPVVAVPDCERSVYVTRDREEEVVAFARRAKDAIRTGRLSTLDGAALVVHQPLPYVYLARTVLGSAGLSCQLFDTLPLAAEPYSAALDLVLTFVSSGFARGPGIHLLRSPHFRFAAADGGALQASDVSALDRALTESGYAGDVDALQRLLDTWADAQPPRVNVVRAGRVLLSLVGELASLRTSAPVSDHLAAILRFMTVHECTDAPDLMRARHFRARSAVLATIAALQDAHARLDREPRDFDEVTALTRRWIEGQTFAPKNGSAGVHVVDSATAAFGSFEHVHCAGLVDGEWPSRPNRSIFYSTAILRELGWPAERDRTEGLRSAFADLLGSPTREVCVSSFLLEHDAIVSPSPFTDELRHVEHTRVEPVPGTLIFDHEALSAGRVSTDVVRERAREWATFRLQAIPKDDSRFRGATGAHVPTGYSLSALERYQDCPFKFFAADILRLDEPPEDGASLTPRTRGRFLHELLQRFFVAWDARGEGPLTTIRLDAARAVFAQVAEPLLAQLPASDAALERARLFGSALSVGIVDTVLAMEVSRSGTVRERWLEYRLEGEFCLGDSTRRVPLRGVADRIDLLEGNRLRVIDYKTGSAPERGRALQVPIYALCAQERLSLDDSTPWIIDEAAYMSFSGKKTSVRVADTDDTELLTSARDRVFEIVAHINGGAFPVRPHEPIRCSYCAYPSVCRKDYVE
jgi:RecB family exonuclease